MSDRSVDLLRRLGRPLRPVTGVVLATGVLAAVLVDAGAPDVRGTRAAGEVSGEHGTAPDDEAPAPVPETQPAAASPEGSAAPPTDGPPPAIGPGLSSVPVAGLYRYRVESTRDGSTTVEDEEREIVQLSGDRQQGLVQITARMGDERQISVVDWSPQAALVQSTRIESGDTIGQDCAWSPPFPEFGALAEGSTWQVASTCRTEVGGIPTHFEVSGGGWVVEPVTVSTPGGDVPTWRIERFRSTRITAVLDGDELEQRVDEQGTFFFDPVRGVVVRSEVEVRLEGAQHGTTQRISVLQS